LINLAGHTFLDPCPASEDQQVTALPRLSKEVLAGLYPKHSGVLGPSPVALWVVASRADIGTTSGVLAQPCCNAELDV
jgi:hypothetical protein